MGLAPNPRSTSATGHVSTNACLPALRNTRGSIRGSRTLATQMPHALDVQCMINRHTGPYTGSGGKLEISESEDENSSTQIKLTYFVRPRATSRGALYSVCSFLQ